MNVHKRSAASGNTSVDTQGCQQQQLGAVYKTGLTDWLSGSKGLWFCLFLGISTVSVLLGRMRRKDEVEGGGETM
jgi:hypothetical protein